MTERKRISVLPSENAGNDIYARRIAFCKKMAEIRQSKGFTQQELADMIGIKQQSVARIEAGKFTPTFDMILRITDALGVRIDFVE